jgi:flagellin-like protein
MKKMWKFRKDLKAVSPVIATILMVAITVVLAAVLYVLVSGYGGGTAVPTAGFSSPVRNSADNYTVTVAEISETYDIGEFKLTITNGTSSFTGTVGVGEITLAPSTTIQAWFVDVGGEGMLGSGDYFVIDFGVDGTYGVKLLWIDSDGNAHQIAEKTIGAI